MAVRVSHWLNLHCCSLAGLPLGITGHKAASWHFHGRACKQAQVVMGQAPVGACGRSESGVAKEDGALSRIAESNVIDDTSYGNKLAFRDKHGICPSFRHRR